MSFVDWLVMIFTMIIIVGFGIWKTRGKQDIQGYLMGGNEAKWWTVGLSVMATQASAVTFLSTPGQAYSDGMDFLQFYFTIPLVMIILCVSFVPRYFKLKVFTAYEFLEVRFDIKTRSLASVLFLIQRGLATGITIYAPAIILSSILNWNLNVMAAVLGVVAIAYTMSGGTKAVHVTHQHQMIVIFIGLIIIFYVSMGLLPDEYSFLEILSLADAQGKMDIVDTQFDWKDRYNIWACLIAAPFLFLSYFGTDQSQVQRYISGESIKASQKGLLFNGFFKLPFQFFILFLGVLVFLVYQFEKAPIFFNQSVTVDLQQSQEQEKFKQLEDDYHILSHRKVDVNKKFIQARRGGDTSQALKLKQEIQQIATQEKLIRQEYKSRISSVHPSIETNDKDYVFINFMLNYLPKGLIGLLIAVIMFAAMSSTASELNALASTTTVDIYKRNFVKSSSDEHYVKASKIFTLIWGLIAIFLASISSLFENLIQFVNIIGSLFYGTILGIFLVAFYFKRVKAQAVFYAALISEAVVIVIYYMDIIGYLWLNLIGVICVILIGHIFQRLFFRKDNLNTLSQHVKN